MKVFYMHHYTDTIITLYELSKLPNNTKIVINKDDREILYTLEDIYKCRDWKVYTKEENSLTLDDVRNLMGKVERNSELYSKLRKEEEKLLNIFVEEISLDFERSLF